MKEKLKVMKSVSVPLEIAEELIKARKETNDSKYGWSAVFMRGYHALKNEGAENNAPEMAIKLEKLASKLNFYVMHSVKLEDELKQLRAEHGK